MKKSKLENSASQSRFGLVHFLSALLLFYFLCISFQFPLIFRTGSRSGSDDGSSSSSSFADALPRQILVGTESNRAIVGEEGTKPSRINRVVVGHVQLPSPEHKVRDFKTVSEIFSNETFFDEFSSVFHKTAKHAISTGKKMWAGLGSGLITKPDETPQKCPDTVSVTGPEFVNRSEILVLPCGLKLGSHVTVVATPHWAHAEKGGKFRGEKAVMVTQFMMELQGLKAAEGEDPPRILHFNPRIRGDWSGRAVIEQNTCYRMQWGPALRCDGRESNKDSVDGEVRCERWKRDDDESRKTWWLNRLMGQRKKITHDWPYPFEEGKLFVLTLRAGMEGFHISVNGRHITSFPYRTGFVLEDATGSRVLRYS